MARTAKDEQSKQIRTPTSERPEAKPDTLGRGRRGATRSEGARATGRQSQAGAGIGGAEQARPEARTARKPPMRTGDVGTPIQRSLGVPLGGRSTPRKEPGEAEITRGAIKSAKSESGRSTPTTKSGGRKSTRSTTQTRGAAKRTGRGKKTEAKSTRSTSRKTTSRASKQAAALPSGGRITEAGTKRGRKSSTRSTSKTSTRGARKTNGARSTAKTSRRSGSSSRTTSTRSTSGSGKSRRELYERARTLDIPGRSHMSKEQLADAIRKAG
jgi:hypothetical protein